MWDQMCCKKINEIILVVKLRTFLSCKTRNIQGNDENQLIECIFKFGKTN